MNSVHLRALPVDDLVALTARGDQRAFGELYDRMASRLLGLAQRLVVDRSIAEEVVQEAMLEAWQHAARFDPARGGASAWLLALTRSRAIDRIRSEQASRDRLLRVGIAEFEDRTEDVASTVERSLEIDETARRLDGVTALQREALSLFYAGFSHREISEQLGVPPNTVKTRVRDGLSRLRAGLQPA